MIVWRSRLCSAILEVDGYNAWTVVLYRLERDKTVIAPPIGYFPGYFVGLQLRECQGKQRDSVIRATLSSCLVEFEFRTICHIDLPFGRSQEYNISNSIQSQFTLFTGYFFYVTIFMFKILLNYIG